AGEGGEDLDEGADGEQDVPGVDEQQRGRPLGVVNVLVEGGRSGGHRGIVGVARPAAATGYGWLPFGPWPRPSPSSRETRPARSYSTRRSAWSTPGWSASSSTCSASTSPSTTAGRPATRW